MFTSETITESGALFRAHQAQPKRGGRKRNKANRLPKLSRALTWLEKVSPPKVLLVQGPEIGEMKAQSVGKAKGRK